MTAQANIRADILGKLLLIQETLDILPDSAGISAFLRRALGEIPGVTDAHLYVGGTVYPPSRELDEVCAKCEAAPNASRACTDCMVGTAQAICVPLRTARHRYGMLILSLDDEEAFSPYRAFVQNIANVVAVTLETREYVRQLDEARAGLEAQVAERTATLRESQEKFRALVETTSDWVWEVDAGGTYTYASPKVEAVLGFKPEEVVGKTLFDFMAPEEAQRVTATFLAASRAAKPLEQVLNTNLHKDGHAVVMETSGTPIFDGDGKVTGYRGIDRDVSARRRAEEALHRLNRELRAISICNQTLIRAVDEQTLLNDICHIICDEAGYRMAWVGYAEHDDAKTVRPVAWAGLDSGYIANAKLTWADDTERGQGPAGKAIRSGEIFYVQDFATDPQVAPWRESALLRGYRSGIVLPLKDESAKVFGVLLMYSAEINPFTPDEIRLLGELSGDLAFGIIGLRARAERRRAEEAVKQSEEKFRLLTERSVVGVYIIQDAKMAYVNPSFAKTFGYAREEITGKLSVKDLIHPDDIQLVMRRMQERLEGKTESSNAVYRGFKKDGSLIDIETYGMAIDYQGRPAVMGSLLDITERKRAEEERRAAALYARSLIEASLDPLMTISPEGKITDVSKATEEVTGLARDRLVGTDFADYFTEPDKARAGYQQVLAEGGVRDYPLTIRHSSGRTTDVLYNAAVFRNEVGELQGVFAAARDVTERKRAQDALHRSEASLKEAQRIAHIGNWELDLVSNDLTWTDEVYRIFEIDPAEFAASYEAFLGAIHPDDREFVNTAYTESVKNRIPYDIEHRLLMMDGRVKYVNERCETAYDPSGRPLRSIGTVQDITARRQAEDALREREEYIRRLVDRSPLAMVVSSGMEQRVELVNAKFTELFGYTIEDMPDVAHWWPLAYPDGQYREEIKAKWSERVARAIESKGEIEPMEATVRCKDGSMRYIEFRLSSVGTRNLVTFVDFTERKRTEREALEQFKLAEAFFKHSVSGLVILDRNFNFVRVNEAYARSCRKDIGEFAGRNHFEMYPSDVQPIFEEVVRSKRPYTTFTRAFVYPDQPERGTTYWDWTLVPILDERGEVEFLVFSLSEVTERKRAEEERLAHLRFFESMDRVNRAIQGAGDLEQMMGAVLDEVLSIFDCDRAWLVYPCDPEAASWAVPMERTKPEYPGARARALEIPMDAEIQRVFRAVRAAERPVTFGPDSEYPLPEWLREQFGVRSQLTMATYPMTGKPWEFGMHQCSYPRAWTQDEQRLFQEINRRLADALTSMLMQRDLRESEEFLDSVVENIPDMVFVKDAQALRFVRFNKAGEQLLGYPREDLLGKNDYDFFPKEEADFFTEKDREVLDQKQLLDIPEETIKTRAQGERILHTKKIPIVDSEGRSRYLLGISEDITERRQAEQALRASEQRLRLHVEQTPLAVIEWDTGFRVVRWNPSAERIFGYTAAEAMGRHAGFIVAAEARGVVDEVWRQLLAGHGGERSTNNNLTKDGRTILCDWYNTPLVMSDGKVVGVASLVEDVTVRKQAEAVRMQLAAIVQSSHDAIIGKDLEGVITSWNPGAEKVYGYRAEEVLGKPVSLLAPESRKDEITGLLARIGRGEAVMNFETERFRKDGNRIDISIDLSPIRDASGRIVGASTIARDITEKKQAERALHKVNRALKALSNCNMALIHATDEIRLLNEICRVIVDIEGYRLAWVGYVEHDAQQTVRPVAQSGYEPGYMEHAEITWADNERGRGPLGIAIRSGRIQVVQDVNTDPRFEPWRANAARLGYGSVLVAPLLSDSQVIGALSINAEGVNAFGAGEIALLSELAADMAFGIVTLRTRGAHEQSAGRLQRSMEATIQAIAGTVEMRDPYTAGHQRRVSELATAIARDMGLAEDQVHAVHLAGVVHDLGKIHVPAEILSKPGKLTRIEFQLIQAHPEAGYEILKGVDFPWPIAQIVFQHHERLDGSGYPRGLKADEILFEAKILMVADVVEAMASHRPYRPALGIDLALQEISANAGKYYDADVARACIALFREKAFTFKE